MGRSRSSQIDIINTLQAHLVLEETNTPNFEKLVRTLDKNLDRCGGGDIGYMENLEGLEKTERDVRTSETVTKFFFLDSLVSGL